MKRVAIVVPLLILGACKGSRTESTQVGYRGLAQELNYDHSDLLRAIEANRVPPPLPPASTPSPPANWQNVQVLNDVSANEMNRTMLAMTNWVAPQAGCTYCHNPTNFASDEKYTKIVARRMLQMTRHINNDYKAHVQGTGVTCYTCHRGLSVPANGLWWYTNQDQYLRAYLDRQDNRVQSLAVAHSNENNSSIKQAENTYALMIGVSQALGVNCTYCHNTRTFASWQNAPPARITALYGFRMVRDLNSNFLTPLQSTFPANRRGPHGDSPKLQCSTCHQGVYKPLLGAAMVKDYPGLWGSASWSRGGASDTVNAGFRDLRTRDSIPVDGAPRLDPQTAKPLPAPKSGVR